MTRHHIQVLAKHHLGLHPHAPGAHGINAASEPHCAQWASSPATARLLWMVHRVDHRLEVTKGIRG